MKNINPTQTTSWKKLADHFKKMQSSHMRDFFEANPQRAEDFTIEWEDFYVDFSKNRINEETQNLLLDLANECGLEEAIASYFNGEVINRTEKRPVLHTALRGLEDDEVLVEGKNVMPEVYQAKKKMQEFS